MRFQDAKARLLKASGMNMLFNRMNSDEWSRLSFNHPFVHPWSEMMFGEMSAMSAMSLTKEIVNYLAP
jgi:hypothetical protein